MRVLTLIGLLLVCGYPTGASAQVDHVSSPVPISTGNAKLDPGTPCAPIEYPRKARLAEATGITQVQVKVGDLGFPVSSVVVKSAGSSFFHKLLDSAAVRHIWSCRFVLPLYEQSITFIADYDWRPEASQ